MAGRFKTAFFAYPAEPPDLRRKMYTDLAINDFKNCLSAVCVSSYFKEKLSFSEAEILEFIRAAAQSQRLEIKEYDFLTDLLESVCILQRDGLFITFTHRSFQEYFAAFFVARSPSTSIADLLDKLCRRAFNENVIPMAFDMNRALIEREWISLRIKELSREIKRIRVKNNIAALAKSMKLMLLARTDFEKPLLCVVMNQTFYFIQTLSKIYDDQSLVYPAKEPVAQVNVYVSLDPRDTELFPEIYRELRMTDQEWLIQTSVAQSLPKLRDALLSLAAKVEASVSQQRKLVGVLFE